MNYDVFLKKIISDYIIIDTIILVNNRPFPTKMSFVQSHSVNLSTKHRVLFLAENWNLKVEVVTEYYNHS